MVLCGLQVMILMLMISRRTSKRLHYSCMCGGRSEWLGIKTDCMKLNSDLAVAVWR